MTKGLQNKWDAWELLINDQKEGDAHKEGIYFWERDRRQETIKETRAEKEDESGR